MVLRGVGGTLGDRALPASQEKEVWPGSHSPQLTQLSLDVGNNCPLSGTTRPLTVVSREPEAT